MRKIEQKIIDCIRNQRYAVALKEYCYKQSKFDNTLIYTGYENDLVVTKVFLHNNLIARGNWHKWEFNMAGWPTSTTKSRINALASDFGHAGVYTKKGRHYSGDKEVDCYSWF